MERRIYIGADSGATTTKIAAIWENGDAVTTQLLQRKTNSHAGRDGVVAGWIAAIDEFLTANGLDWRQIAGAGLAIPGPYLGRGIMDKSPNFPAEFAGWNVQEHFVRALAAKAGRNIPLQVGNDGNYGGVAEARVARGNCNASVLMLMPGSGLGCAYIGANGLPLEGDTLAGLEAGHAPAVLQVLGITAKPLSCGCGRDWGCVEAYTTISGLPQLLAEKLKDFPDHEFATSSMPIREKAFSLRDRAQKDDPLAVAIFDFQARVMGLHIANLAMTLDPGIVVIGGGLMDHGATTTKFRERYLRIVNETARPYLWNLQRDTIRIIPASLGDLSQAIGAALVALYAGQKAG